MAHLHTSWLDPHKIRKVTVVGSRKMAVIDDVAASEKVRLYDKGVDIGEAGLWFILIGQGAFAAGFYLSVKPMVEAQLAALKDKVKSATSEKKPEDAGDGGDS